MFLLICITLATVFIVKYFLKSTEKDLTGQVVLVTGGANGLGKALCARFAGLGCKIAVVDLDLSNAEKTVKEILDNGVCKEARAYKVDVSMLNEIENLKTKIEADLGPVDIVINNAAILYTKSIEKEDPKMLQKIMDVNTMALFWTTRVFIPGMKERKRGHIVSIASAAGLIGSPHLQSYSASKFAVRGFMESLYVDLKLEGHDKYIHTTTVYPWFINTREYIQEFTGQVFKYCFVFDTKYVVKLIVEGVRRNERVVTIPKFMYFFGYFLNMSNLTNFFMSCLGDTPKKDLSLNYKYPLQQEEQQQQF